MVNAKEKTKWGRERGRFEGGRHLKLESQGQAPWECDFGQSLKVREQALGHLKGEESAAAEALEQGLGQ